MARFTFFYSLGNHGLCHFQFGVTPHYKLTPHLGTKKGFMGMKSVRVEGVGKETESFNKIGNYSV